MGRLGSLVALGRLQRFGSASESLCHEARLRRRLLDLVHVDEPHDRFLVVRFDRHWNMGDGRSRTQAAVETR